MLRGRFRRHQPRGVSALRNSSSMDNSLTLARYFARLVWLLVHDGQSVPEQKAALRGAITVSKDASVRLGTREGRLAVNGLVMPQALTGVEELSARLSAHAIDEIEIDQGAVPAELLALARVLAVEAKSTSDVADVAQKLSLLAGGTVRVRRSVGSERAPTRTSGAIASVGAQPAAPQARLSALVMKLEEELTPATAQPVLDELAVMAEQGAREGRIADVAAIFSALLDRETEVTDPEVRRIFHVTVRRLTKPTLLRPIAQQLASEPVAGSRTERILQRCGQDGVDAVVDRYTASRSVAERRTYRDALSRLTLAREALVQMLGDPRWHVVRQAVEFLGEMGAEEAERPLAELLRHNDDRVRRAATRALARGDSTFTLDALARAVVDLSPAVRIEAVVALASRKGGRAGAMLANAIDKEDEQEVQYAILGALGRVAAPEAVQKLVKAAEAASGLFTARKDRGLRVAAVYALGEARTPGALAALQALSHDKEKDVKDAAARTLLLLRSTAA
jgi:hypothetical protein